MHAANESDRKTVYIWVKNVGKSRIFSVEASDVFFGLETDFTHIPHEDDAGASYPRWSDTLVNDTEWASGATLKVTIAYDPGGASPSTGTYFIKMIIPNGISDEYFFSM